MRTRRSLSQAVRSGTILETLLWKERRGSGFETFLLQYPTTTRSFSHCATNGGANGSTEHHPYAFGASCQCGHENRTQSGRTLGVLVRLSDYSVSKSLRFNARNSILCRLQISVLSISLRSPNLRSLNQCSAVAARTAIWKLDGRWKKPIPSTQSVDSSLSLLARCFHRSRKISKVCITCLLPPRRNTYFPSLLMFENVRSVRILCRRTPEKWQSSESTECRCSIPWGRAVQVPITPRRVLHCVCVSH